MLVVTGTNTGIGKTVASAALVSRLTSAGRSVAMVKPVQTGTDESEPTDAATVARLSGIDDVAELASLPDPLAPDSAARLRGRSLPGIAEHARTAIRRFPDHDVIVVEGAGGVLVRLDTDDGTLIDFADAAADAGQDVRFVVVTSLALGTLNHTELTVSALRGRGHHVTGLVVGDVPDRLGLAETCNLDDLGRVTGLDILASLPHGAGALSPAEFQAQCTGWFAPAAVEVLTCTPTREGWTASS